MNNWNGGMRNPGMVHSQMAQMQPPQAKKPQMPANADPEMMAKRARLAQTLKKMVPNGSQ